VAGDVKWITCGQWSRIRALVDRGQGRRQRPRRRGGGRRGGLDGEEVGVAARINYTVNRPVSGKEKTGPVHRGI
jgi:hypothetical protein